MILSIICGLTLVAIVVAVLHHVRAEKRFEWEQEKEERRLEEGSTELGRLLKQRDDLAAAFVGMKFVSDRADAAARLRTLEARIDQELQRNR